MILATETHTGISALSAGEAKRLAELERVIEAAKETFAQVARALCEIRDRKLYRQSHRTFAEYCNVRFSWAKSYSYYLATAGEVLKSLPENFSTLVENEGQARALAKVPEADRPRVIEQAINGNGKLTAELLRAAVDRNVILKAACAIRGDRRAAKIEELKSIETVEPKEANGLYDVLVVDPPWPIQKIERDCRPNQVKQLDYPTMTLEEIKGLSIPTADTAHLWLWTTQRFLQAAFDILKAWQFNYCCTFVWHKPGGFQPYALPQFNCEFALYGRRGSPSFASTKALKTCFEARRGRHSKKPLEFYEMVRRVTSGRRLDMFNRQKITGFDGWGKEAK